MRRAEGDVRYGCVGGSGCDAIDVSGVTAAGAEEQCEGESVAEGLVALRAAYVKVWCTVLSACGVL